jgi:hypothetical protein
MGKGRETDKAPNIPILICEGTTSMIICRNAMYVSWEQDQELVKIVGR